MYFSLHTFYVCSMQLNNETLLVFMQITDLPFSLYSTFVIEARHGFNKVSLFPWPFSLLLMYVYFLVGLHTEVGMVLKLEVQYVFIFGIWSGCMGNIAIVIVLFLFVWVRGFFFFGGGGGG